MVYFEKENLGLFFPGAYHYKLVLYKILRFLQASDRAPTEEGGGSRRRSGGEECA